MRSIDWSSDVCSSDLRELLGTGVLPLEDEHEYHTAAGMIIAQFGRIPNVGEHFEWSGWRIEILDLDGPRIDKLLLQHVAATSAHHRSEQRRVGEECGSTW